MIDLYDIYNLIDEPDKHIYKLFMKKAILFTVYL